MLTRIRAGTGTHSWFYSSKGAAWAYFPGLGNCAENVQIYFAVKDDQFGLQFGLGFNEGSTLFVPQYSV